MSIPGLDKILIGSPLDTVFAVRLRRQAEFDQIGLIRIVFDEQYRNRSLNRRVSQTSARGKIQRPVD